MRIPTILTACLLALATAASAADAPDAKTAPPAAIPLSASALAFFQATACTANMTSASLLAHADWTPGPAVFAEKVSPQCTAYCCDLSEGLFCEQTTCTGCIRVGGHPYLSLASCCANCPGAC